VPTADHAYASTQYIIHDSTTAVPTGLPLLGLLGMRCLLFAICPSFFSGARIKTARTHLAGWVALFAIVWDRLHRLFASVDQRAYWATTVGVEIMDKMPLLGDFMSRFLKESDPRTDDIEPVLVIPRHGAPRSPDWVGRVASLPF